MGKTKKVTRTSNDSPSAREAQELEEVEAADKQPEQNVEQSKKKAKRSQSRGSAVAKPPKKKKNEPETEVDEEEEVPSIDIDRIREAVKAFRSENKRKPTAEELSEGMEVDEAAAGAALKLIKKQDDRLSHQRRAQRVKGYRKISKAAGYGYDANGSTNVISQGIDSLQSLISMSDALRLVQFVPFTPEGVSYSELEFKERVRGLLTTLPQSAAREVVANADSVLRWAVNKAVAETVQQRGVQRVNPSTMVSVLKPYAERMTFSSVLTPPGLIKYAKDEAPPARKDFAEYEEQTSKGRFNKTFVKALAEYKKRVPFVDRGLGLIEVSKDDEIEWKVTADNTKAAQKNAEHYKQITSDIAKEKAERAKFRSKVKALAVRV